jgi:hypothetical protein
MQQTRKTCPHFEESSEIKFGGEFFDRLEATHGYGNGSKAETAIESAAAYDFLSGRLVVPLVQKPVIFRPVIRLLELELRNAGYGPCFHRE